VVSNSNDEIRSGFFFKLTAFFLIEIPQCFRYDLEEEKPSPIAS